MCFYYSFAKNRNFSVIDSVLKRAPRGCLRYCISSGRNHLICNKYASAGKKNKLRLYYLSWLRNKILHNDPEVEKRQGWTSVGDLEGCVHYKVGE